MIDSEYVITEKTPLVQEFIALRTAVGWGELNRDALARGLSGSLMCVCVRHGGKLVGFGRVVGDGCFVFYIQDMIVHPDHQRKGLGKAVMSRIMGYIETAGGEDIYIGLMATKGKAGFYEQFGFMARPEDAPGMQLWLKNRRH